MRSYIAGTRRTGRREQEIHSSQAVDLRPAVIGRSFAVAPAGGRPRSRQSPEGEGVILGGSVFFAAAGALVLWRVGWMSKEYLFAVKLVRGIAAAPEPAREPAV